MRISDWISDVCSSDLSAKVNVSAGCSGGQTASVLASQLAADKDDILGSLTLMVCVLHPKQNDIEAGSPVSGNGLKLARKRAETAGVIKRKATRRVGKECVSTCRSRWSLFPYNK